MPRPPAALVPDDTVDPPPELAKALAVADLAVGSAALPKGTEGPLTVPVVMEAGTCWASTEPPIDRRLSLRVGVVDEGCEGGAMLCVEPDAGAVTTICPGRLVNFRGDEGTEDVEGDGDGGATVLSSAGLESVP